MKKLLFAIILLFITTLSYAETYTNHYRIEIPAIGARDWQPVFSRDVISIDSIVYMTSRDIGIISSDSAAQDIKIQILSNDAVTQNTNISILSNDAVTQDTKLQILSNDAVTWKNDRVSQDAILNSLKLIGVTGQVISADASGAFVGATISGTGDILYADTRYYIAGFTRAMDAATGNVAYSGLGFTPKAVWFFGATVTIANEMSFGMTTATASASLFSNGGVTANTWGVSNTVLEIWEAAGKNQIATLASIDGDGFTLTWTRTGVTAAGNANVYYLALR